MEEQVNNYRYERKFFIENCIYEDIIKMIKFHPALFSEIYHSRYVNNIYFDTASMECYIDNIEGSMNRIKYRLRWYGSLFGEIRNPTLELKIKNALVGRKELYKLDSMIIDRNVTKNQFKEYIDHSNLPKNIQMQLRLLYPALINQYQRKYFRSANGKFRITIDRNMKYFRFKHLNDDLLFEELDKSHIILELKYNTLDEISANHITNYFPLRMTKCSKYVMGIDKVNYT